MALAVSHPFVSAKPDGGDTSLIQPSNWNAGHSLSGELPVANGGTGSANAAGARTALGLAIGTDVMAHAATASEAEMQTGTEAALRAMSPDLVAAAIAALTPVYAAGDWTPAITAATPGTLSLTYTTQVGKYVRIGRQVTVSFHIQINTFTLGTATGDLRISGLPFDSSADNVNFYGNTLLVGVDLPTASPLSTVLSLTPSLSYLVIKQSVDNTSTSTGQIGGLAAGDYIIGSLTYFTDAA